MAIELNTFFTPISPRIFLEDTSTQRIKKMAITLSEELWSHPHTSSYEYSGTIIYEKISPPSKVTYQLFAAVVLALIIYKKPRLGVLLLAGSLIPKLINHPQTKSLHPSPLSIAHAFAARETLKDSQFAYVGLTGLSVFVSGCHYGEESAATEVCDMLQKNTSVLATTLEAFDFSQEDALDKLDDATSEVINQFNQGLYELMQKFQRTEREAQNKIAEITGKLVKKSFTSEDFQTLRKLLDLEKLENAQDPTLNRLIHALKVNNFSALNLNDFTCGFTGYLKERMKKILNHRTYHPPFGMATFVKQDGKNYLHIKRVGHIEFIIMQPNRDSTHLTKPNSSYSPNELGKNTSKISFDDYSFNPKTEALKKLTMEVAPGTIVLSFQPKDGDAVRDLIGETPDLGKLRETLSKTDGTFPAFTCMMLKD